MTTKYIILDAWRSNFVSVSAVQGETAARFLDVTLTGNGTAINLSDKTVAIYYKKPDGTTIFNSGTIKDATAGLVEIPLTSQMSVLSGEMKDVEIRVTQTGGGTLKIKGLRITIEAAESYDSAVESTDEYTALESALANVTAMTSHMANKNNPHAVTAAQLGAVPITRQVNGKALSSDITLAASDVGARANTWLPSASDLINIVYPVGSIYMSVNSTSPATLFGGTWERLKDRFLLGAGDTYTAGTTGGEAAHVLTIPEMPSHTHSAKFNGVSTATGTSSFRLTEAGTNDYTGGNNSAGGGAAHNNMPPYLAVYMWKRTA